jgi:hypothetical protein
VRQAQVRVTQILEDREQGARKGLSPVPNEPLPSPPGKSEATKRAYYNFMPLRLYGYEKWGDLFTARQKVALITLVTPPTRSMEGEAALEALSLAVSRCIEQSSSFVRWRITPWRTQMRSAGALVSPMHECFQNGMMAYVAVSLSLWWWLQKQGRLAETGS